MQNPQIIQMIENLKGRRNYEENKASKLGFSSLYAYLEDRILKEEKVIYDKDSELKEMKSHNDIQKKEKKSCSCC
tara:strand:+ start:50 stop:274 length:225 start_codon:yes stop_codon:yes gene_type:complete